MSHAAAALSTPARSVPAHEAEPDVDAEQHARRKLARHEGMRWNHHASAGAAGNGHFLPFDGFSHPHAAAAYRFLFTGAEPEYSAVPRASAHYSLSRANLKRMGPSLAEQHEELRPSKRPHVQPGEEQSSNGASGEAASALPPSVSPHPEEAAGAAPLNAPPLNALREANRILHLAHEERAQRRRMQLEQQQQLLLQVQQAAAAHAVPPSPSPPSPVPSPSLHSFVYRSPSIAAGTSEGTHAGASSSGILDSPSISAARLSLDGIPRSSAPKLTASPLLRFHQAPRAWSVAAPDVPLSGMRSLPAHLPWHGMVHPSSSAAATAATAAAAAAGSDSGGERRFGSWAASPVPRDEDAAAAAAGASAADSAVLYMRRPMVMRTSPWQPQMEPQEQPQPPSAANGHQLAVPQLSSQQQPPFRSHSGSMQWE